MTRRILGVLLVALLAGLLPSSVAGPAAAAGATVTAAAFDGEGGFPYDGAFRSYIAPAADIIPDPAATITPTDVTLIVKSPSGCQPGTGGCDYYRLRFVAPAGKTAWTTGSYVGVEPGSQQAGQAGISALIGSNQGYAVASPIHIDEAAFDGAGHVTAFAVRFEYHSNYVTSPGMFGSIAYQSHVPWRARQVTPSPVTFPTTPLGTTSDPVSVWVANKGTAALTFKSITIGGDHPEDFAIDGDACSAAPLDAGAGCAVLIRFTPSYLATSQATLEIVDDFAPDGRLVALSGLGGPPVGALSGFSLDTEPGDPIGLGYAGFGDTPTATGDRSRIYGGGYFSSGGYHPGANNSYYHFELTAPPGGQLAVGSYEDTRSAASPGHPGLDISAWGWGCSDSTGRFVIDDISFGRSGVVEMLAIRFEQHCTYGTGTLFGQVLISSLAPMHVRQVFPNDLQFGAMPVGQAGELNVTIDNLGPDTDPIASLTVSGSDFELAGTTCGSSLAADSQCTATVRFRPSGGGDRTGSLVLFDGLARPGGRGRHVSLSGSGPTPPPPDNGGGAGGDPTSGSGSGAGSGSGSGPAPSPGLPAVPTARSGYWMLGRDGAVYAFGDAASLGNAGVGVVAAVDLEPTPSGNGYWIVDEQGRVFSFGDAGVFGGLQPGALAPGERVTSLSAPPSGSGYWLFTTKGRVIPFGRAQWFGDMRRVALNGPVLDSIATPSGNGYYMVASDGGIFSFGDAVYRGSMGGQRLNAPVESLVPDSDGDGYWLVASDGGIFAFRADFRGSMGNQPLNRPINGMVRFGSGYLMVAEDGGIFNFSDRPFLGSLADRRLSQPITSVAVLNG